MSDEMVTWAYRLLLGREPEPGAVENNPFKDNTPALVAHILNGAEWQSKSRTLWKKPPSPFDSRQRTAYAFMHLPKTGGTTLSAMLEACFPPERICPQKYNGLHTYSASELAQYDLFSGHFDYYSTSFIPRVRVVTISVFRDPLKRLISFYRFCRSHPPEGEWLDQPAFRLARELSPEEYFRHPAMLNSPYHNNAYLFFFGSSVEDRDLLAKINSGEDVSGVLDIAVERVRSLDAIGLADEQFESSARSIFARCGLKMPERIISQRVTDDLPAHDLRFQKVPPVEVTPRLRDVLGRLTACDTVIYDVAREEFARRLG